MQEVLSNAVATAESPQAAVPAVGTSSLSVSVAPGLVGLERLAADIDRLNRAGIRPNPFLSTDFLRCYSLHIEYHQPGLEECVYVIRDGSRVVGCAPMRRSIDFFGPRLGGWGLQAGRLRLMAPLDTEQPGIVCEPQQEARVAAALVRHICERETGWGILEFVGQRPGGALHRAVHAAAGDRFRARDIEVEPYNEIALVWSDVGAYFRSLVKKMRSNVSRQARRLYASGNTELILAEGSAAVSAWFDAYVDLDGRSWKHGTDASIARHPRRVNFYREVAAGRGGLEPSFIGVVLDGVLIAGLLVGSNARDAADRHGAWCLEMAYDRSRAELGPGQLLLLLAVGEALRRGDRHLNFMQNFAYYKHRWQAEPIDVVAVQLIRRASLQGLRAQVGDWKKRRSAPEDARPTEDEPSPRPSAPLSAEARERALGLTRVALGAAGAGMRRVSAADARTYLPFALD